MNSTREGERLDYDLHDALIPVSEAARLAGVATSTVHNWVSRGYLNRDDRRQYLRVESFDGARHFVPMDVLKAEAATRRRAGRELLRCNSG